MYNIFGEVPAPMSPMSLTTYPTRPLPPNTIVSSSVVDKEIDKVEVYGTSGLSLTLRDVSAVIYGGDQYIAVHFKNGNRKIFPSNNIMYIDIRCKEEVKQEVP